MAKRNLVAMTSRLVAISALLLLLLPLTTRAQKPQLFVQLGHSGAVFSVAFSPDGKLLASGGNDQTVKLWEVSTGIELRSLRQHCELPCSVTSVAFSPDGKILASIHAGKVALWDVSTGKEMSRLGHSDSVSITFSPNGKLVATGSRDRTIKLWDISTGTDLRTLKGHFIPIAIAFSRDGKTFASGDEGEIKLWDVTRGTELRTFKWHSDKIPKIVFSPDGKILASSDDGEIKLWDVTSGTELRTLKGHSSKVVLVAFGPDGKTLTSGSTDNTVKLWDVTSGGELRTLKGHSAAVTSVALSADGKTLASGSRDHTVELWDGSTGTTLHTLTGNNDWVFSVAFSPDGKSLASGRRGSKGKLWDFSKEGALQSFGAAFSVAFSPDGKTVAGSVGDTIKLWDPSDGRELRTLQDSLFVASVAFSPDGKTLASGSVVAKLWDVSTGTELRTLHGRSIMGNNPIAFSPNGEILAAGSTVILSDVSTGEKLIQLKGNSGLVSSVAFSPDGKTIATGGNFSRVTLLEVSTGTELRTLEGHSNEINSVAFSPDGKTLASGGLDGLVKLWDVASGAELHTLKGHSSDVNSVKFSRNGKYLASGSSDTSIRIWDITSGREVASLVAFDGDDWMVVTPDGLFDGSPAAWNKIRWRFNNNTFEHAPVEVFFAEFYSPGLLADIFAGKRPKALTDISQKDRRQPRLKLTIGDTQASAMDSTSDVGGNPTVREGARTFALKIDVAELAADKTHATGSGAKDVRLFRNGSLVKVWRGDVLKGQRSVTLEATVPIVARENKFTAYAFNHDNIKSNDATLVVNGADSLKRQGTAYIFAIGVNAYSNKQYNLNYAVPDAKDFAAEIKRQQQSLKRYAKIEVISLADDQATKANITEKLSELAKQVQPEDAVIVFFAGHGTAQGNQFYLIPHDLGYDGPRDNLTQTGLQTILEHSISDRELERLFEGIDAGHLLLVIDACNSGQALEAEEKRRGPMNSKGLAQLAYEKGMYVLTAAQSYQAAIEAERFGHGYLTYALVEEGLKKGSADREPRNGAIDIREWLNFATEEVPRMQEQNSLDALRSRKRYVVFVGDGREVGVPKNEAGARDNIQRPRVFYRRDLESNPLVIGTAGPSAPQ